MTKVSVVPTEQIKVTGGSYKGATGEIVSHTDKMVNVIVQNKSKKMKMRHTRIIKKYVERKTDRLTPQQVEGHLLIDLVDLQLIVCIEELCNNLRGLDFDGGDI